MAEPQIWFAGDPHGEFRHVVRLAMRQRPHAVVFLGDLELTMSLSTVMKPLLAAGIAVHGIHGNHDVDSQGLFDRLATDAAYAAFNLDGVVAEIAGVRIAGLGGVFREKVWYPPDAPLYRASEELHEKLVTAAGSDTQKRHRLNGLRLLHNGTIFPAVYDRLAMLQADVLVAHEAPGGPDLHPHGIEAIDELAQMLGARHGFHGHHHQILRYPAKGPVVWCGVGYREIVDLEGKSITE